MKQNEEFVLNYSSGTIYFEKNSFLSNKKISPIVDFVVFDLEGSEIFRLGHQNLYQYSLFYIEGISLDQKKYSVKIFESIGDKCIYNDILEIISITFSIFSPFFLRSF